MTTDNRFPMMVYRAPGSELVHGVPCQTLVVNDLDEMEGAQDAGFHPTAQAAGEALAAEQAQAVEAAAAEARAKAQAEADEAAAAIRAPLLAEIDGLKAQLANEQEKHAKAQQELAEERAAHAKTKAAAEAPAKAGKSKA